MKSLFFAIQFFVVAANVSADPQITSWSALVYGPCGYFNPTNPASGLRRMVSGFVLRNGEHGADNLALSGRKTRPAWAARETRAPAKLDANEFGPDVSEQYPLGHYLEDYTYLGDCGKTLGRDSELDELNGRWCETPEFPQGAYTCFTAIDANGKPVYPYNLGRRFHGNPIGGLVRSLNEAVTTSSLAHAAAAKSAAATPAKTTSLTWNPSAGGYEAK